MYNHGICEKYRNCEIIPLTGRYFHGGNYTKSIFQYGNISFLKGLGGEKLHKAKSEIIWVIATEGIFLIIFCRKYYPWGYEHWHLVAICK